LWYAFQPADAAPDERPLAILWNGGPGAATGILFGYGTARASLDPAVNGGAAVGLDPSSWTRFANLLYVDARGTGFSYGLADGMDDEARRAAEFDVRNFNPLLDARSRARRPP